jgi:hypothetical protein
VPPRRQRPQLALAAQPRVAPARAADDPHVLAPGRVGPPPGDHLGHRAAALARPPPALRPAAQHVAREPAPERAVARHPVVVVAVLAVGRGHRASERARQLLLAGVDQPPVENRHRSPSRGRAFGVTGTRSRYAD